MQPELPVSKSEQDEIAFAIWIATTGGVVPSKDAELIVTRYLRGEIDYENAQTAIGKLYQEH